MATVLRKSSDLDSKWMAILIIASLASQVHSEWWSMGRNEATLEQAANRLIPCSEIKSLSRSQRTLCESYRDHLKFVSEGASEGVAECQHQFRHRRWNCTTTATNTGSNGTGSQKPLFGKVIDIGSRETAFTYAISAAAVVHNIARACKMGELSNCGCSDEPRPRGLGPNWSWGGCGDNTMYAYGFAREFIDARERDLASPLSGAQSRGRKAMNVHNNEVGRLAVVRGARPTCKCHGVSGSCSINSCWWQTAQFRTIGDTLQKKLTEAVEVKMTRRHGLRSRRRVDGSISDSKLVFLESSPDYCTPNPATGVVGTTGRYCNKDSTGPDGCGLLCCGRPHASYTEVITERCHCKFHWCCHVKCEVCRKRVKRHVCT